MLTPLDIENKKFSKQMMNGYNVDEVDDFLDELTADYEKLYKENSEIKTKVEEMENNLSKYRNIETTLQNTLMIAQTTAEEVKSVAQKEADQILKNAQLEAKSSIEELNTQIIAKKQEFEEVKKQIDVYKAKIEALLISQLELLKDIKEGMSILLDDGFYKLTVISVEEDGITCRIENSGSIKSRRGVCIPGVKLNVPYVSEQDKEDIKFGAEQGIDFIAASFVRNAECILEIKAYLKSLGAPYIPIIAKIENEEGISNIDEIIRAADGIMVARGDLGVEIPAEELPYLQKMMIQKCNDQFKTVITATQMLDSMMRNPRPTRAEVTDVANAVYDGTDAVMLSGETAQGKYPLEALQMMVHIIEQTEKHLDYDSMLEKEHGHLRGGVSSAIGYSSVLAAANLNAKCIITPSVSGATSRVVSNLRPRQEILGVTPNERTLRRMSIYWGVRPLKSLEVDTTEDICENAIELAQVKQYVEPGDVVVITAGIPSTNVSKERSFTSNMMRIVTVD